MTTKSIKDPDFMHWQVRDMDTGELLSRVIWADDSTGWAIVREPVPRFVSGNFRLEDKREKDGLQEALEGAKKIVAFFEALVEEREAWRAGG